MIVMTILMKKVSLYIKKRSLEEWICMALSCMVFFQAAFTLKIGGNLKVYNIVLFFLLFWFLTNLRIPDRRSFLFFLIFVLAPVSSYVFGFCLFDEKVTLYRHFPGAVKNLKLNIFSGPPLALFFYLTTWAGIWFLLKTLNKEYFESVLRVFVIMGILVSLYTLYGSIMVRMLGCPDIVPKILDNRNYTPANHYRVSGFSQEPGDYVYLKRG